MQMAKIINKGTGAGGAKTTKNGIEFEEKTSIEHTLSSNNFIKIVVNKRKKDSYYFENNYSHKKIIYMKQNGLKYYFKQNFDIDIYKKPDEAFLVCSGNKYHLKILEKKNQNVGGSVEDKLKTGLFSKKEYEKMLNKKKLLYTFEVSYAFCISKFLQNKFESTEIKYLNMKNIMMEDGIELFYGDNEDYYNKVYEWINKI